MIIDHLKRLAGHMAWADDLVLAALHKDPGSDPAALEYFAHVVGTEDVWLARIHGRAPETAVWPKLALDECAALAERNRGELNAVIETLAGADPGRAIAYRNSAGLDFVSRLDDILLHMMLHGAYHRGQVSLMMRRSGGTPAPTDFIAFVRGKAAATRERGSGGR